MTNGLWRNVQQWLLCGCYTGWSHELDYHTGRCRYCGQAWGALYPPA